MVTAKQFETLMPDATELWSDEPEMESSQHYDQLALLVTCLEWNWRDRDDFFIGANLTVYYSRQQLRHREFLGPDFFLVRDTERRPRKSWVVWEENGRYPDLIIELLSTSTANVDRTSKMEHYQNQFRTPEYFWFSPETLEFAGFRLVQQRYEPIVPDAQGQLWSRVLGYFLGIDNEELRFFTPDGDLLPTPGEAAEQAQQQAHQQVEQAQQQVEQVQQQAEQAQQQAEQERLRAQRLAEQLRALGIDPDAEEAT
ncbi:MAG: hypothetical protein ETSY1_33325 [Candidatus Entotheonella factor]|uniref:Putative restriction endonuclease domain-containing protein n=1 Tax=Entotheonella factor TaxID=1429438 RepID=W4LA80_ENTF1|nr:MAG: hypothetical protein ETSY1_33325 [Candidatus Entotheonella factor]